MNVLLATLVACGSADTEPAGASFTRVQDEILTPSCAFTSCHAASSGSAGLDLTAGAAYESLIDAPARDAAGETLVVPGDALASYLRSKCADEDDIIGDAMPIGSEGGLDAERLALLTAWIDAGALP